jgi:hypothetical protein
VFLGLARSSDQHFCERSGQARGKGPIAQSAEFLPLNLLAEPGFRLGLVFAWLASTDATRVPLDFGQGGVQRTMWPVLNAGHGFHGMTLRVDHELIGAVLPDVSHRAAEQVRKMPDTWLDACDDHIHI